MHDEVIFFQECICMKILLVSDTYPPDVNGAAYFTYRLGFALAKKGHEVHVAAPALAWKDTTVLEGGLIVHRVRSLPVLFHSYFRFCPPSAARSSLRDIVLEVRPDVIHVQNHFLLGRAAILLAKALRIPLIGTNHFMPENLMHFLHLPAFIEKKVVTLAWKHFSRVYAPVDFVTTPTKTAADLLRAIGFQKEIRPISCGIDLQRFHPGYDAEDLRAKFGIPLETPVILSVGRLEKEKNPEVILRAFALVLSKQEARLLYVGKGEAQEGLKRLVQKLDLKTKVIFADFVEDVDLPRIFSLATVFATASIAELQSIATMEAMASGLPVVAANALALPELVHDGKNGYLFPPGDIVRLSESLISIISNTDQREDMSEESLRMIQRHKAEATTVAFEEIYRQAMAMYR